MPLVPRKGVLAIAAVVDIAINASVRAVSAKTLAPHVIGCHHATSSQFYKRWCGTAF